MVYWQGINDQLEKLVLNCKLCLKYLNAKSKQAPNMSLGQEVLVHPWTKVATDMFHFENESHLLIVDYTSRFPIVHKLMSTTAQQVASQMKLIFSEYGWPETIVSDNGPCYSPETFTKLMTDYSVNHITSSPHYQQSNSLVEKYVQIVKNLFYKAKEEGNDLYKSLMIYRNTPLSHQVAVPYVDPAITNCQNSTTNVQCSKNTTGTRLRTTESEQQE